MRDQSNLAMTVAEDILNHYEGSSSIIELTTGTPSNRIPAPFQSLPMDDEYHTTKNISPVDNLFSALVECFGIILLGYLAGR